MKLDKQILIILGAVYAPVVILLGFIGLHNSTAIYTRDPQSLGNLPSYAGLLSNIGIILWSTAVAIAIFTAFLVTEKQLFLLQAGALSALLGLDDVFQLHDVVLPNNGVPKKLGLTILGILIVVFLIRWRTMIRDTSWPILALAIASFAIWAIVGAGTGAFEGRGFLQSSYKFVGIVGWVTWVVLQSYRAVRPAPPVNKRLTSPI